MINILIAQSPECYNAPMHELSVTENILNICNRYAEQVNASAVTDVYLVIGQLSSIIDDSVQFYWDFVTKNTVCENSILHFERIPAKAKCLNCEKEFAMTELMPCPHCHSARFKIVAGEEFFVDSIKIKKIGDQHVQ
jgi:hydrogenase nickel incorporation protein HypA/HybF